MPARSSRKAGGELNRFRASKQQFGANVMTVVLQVPASRCFCSDAIGNGLNAKVQGLPVGVRLFPNPRTGKADGTNRDTVSETLDLMVVSRPYY